jgi:hypothetical protein
VIVDSPKAASRTIIVGDVHGCSWELERLLDRVQFASGDRLVFVGDLVARGPDSLGVFDIARRTGAVIVRGNHEQKLLDWYAHDDVQLGRIHADLARALRPVDWTLLATSPLYVDMPEHGLAVVHAGVMPGVALQSQHPHTLMHIRTVKGERLWGQAYEGPPQIVFGHNALPGLQLHPWATGLDTGCVYGGRLTALVLGANQKLPRSILRRQALLVSVPARRVYFEGARKRRVA